MYQMRSGKTLLGLLMMFSMLLSACATGPSPEAAGHAEGKGFDLSGYERVMIDPVTVSFDKDWEPVPTGSHISMGQSAREDIEALVADLFDERFRQGLASGNAVEIVSTPGPGVLRITPELQDVYLSASAPMQAQAASYVRSVGHMTVHLAFRDSSTGEVVLELHDDVRGRDIGLLRPSNAVYRSELTRIFDDWAQVIRQDLFRAP